MSHDTTMLHCSIKFQYLSKNSYLLSPSNFRSISLNGSVILSVVIPSHVFVVLFATHCVL